MMSETFAAAVLALVGGNFALTAHLWYKMGKIETIILNGGKNNA